MVRGRLNAPGHAFAPVVWSMTSGGHTWNVVSYLRTSKTLSTGGNLRDFINDARNKGWISPNPYIVGIELGNEIMQGHGFFNCTNYSLSP